MQLLPNVYTFTDVNFYGGMGRNFHPQIVVIILRETYKCSVASEGQY